MFKKWSRWEIVLLVASIVLFLATRLYHLQAKFWPMFTDEAIYVHWAQQGFFEPAMRLTSLSDGKQPLFIWFVSLAMNWIGNPLLAGRLVSVASGIVTLWGLYLLTLELFKKRITGLIAVWLYVFWPLAVIHNRFALFETLTGTFFVWGLYLSVILARQLKTETALELGLVFGGGMLTKTSGFVSLSLLPTTILFLERIPKNIFRWILLLVITSGLGLVYYAILLLSPDFGFINAKNTIFLYNVPEVLGRQFFTIFFRNLSRFIPWVFSYFSWPWVILALLSVFLKRSRKETFFLWLSFLLPFFALAALGKLVYPRYLFFFSLALLPLIAETLVWIKDVFRADKTSYLLIALSFIFAGFADYKILTDFARAPIPSIDLFQYVNGWPAGGGVKEIVDFLQKEANKGLIYVYTEGVYGSLPTTALDIYFRDEGHIKHRSFSDIPESVPQEILASAQKAPVYIVFNQTQKPPKWPISLVAHYQKGTGNWYISLYRLK